MATSNRYSLLVFSFILLLVILTSDLLHASSNYKETNLVFYVHDNLNQTSTGKTFVAVAGVNGSSSNILKFGTVLVTDSPMTQGPEASSMPLGRLQGLAANSDLGGSGFHIVLSAIFQAGEYNGSTLEMQGADPVRRQREVSVVGGTGRFRFAHGYAVAETISLVNLDAVVL